MTFVLSAMTTSNFSTFHFTHRLTQYPENEVGMRIWKKQEKWYITETTYV